MNYEIISQDNRKHIVHVNRLKRCFNQSLWNPKNNQKSPKQRTKRRDSSEGEEEEFRVGPFPLITADDPTPENECVTPQGATLDTPDTDRRTFDTPSPSKDDPNYNPLETPRSHREIQNTRAGPPITRARARNMLQDVTDA